MAVHLHLVDGTHKWMEKSDLIINNGAKNVNRRQVGRAEEWTDIHSKSIFQPDMCMCVCVCGSIEKIATTTSHFRNFHVTEYVLSMYGKNCVHRNQLIK